MARVTVEDCLENVANRFELVQVATKRARQLANGKEALVPLDGDKPTVVALREIAENLINEEVLKAVEKAEQEELAIEVDVDAADQIAEEGNRSA